MLTPVASDAGTQETWCDVKVDPETLLPLSLVRQHTKTDDIPSITDEVLAVYRTAALDAAERYTGFLLQEKKVITEEVQVPQTWSPYRHSTTFKYELKHPLAEPDLYVYGRGLHGPRRVVGQVGQTQVRLPVLSSSFTGNCCGDGLSDAQMRVMYYAGFSGGDRELSAIQLGALKYIAHCIENPGDVVIATNEAGRSTTGYSLSDAADPALASGAIEIWRSVVGCAI